MLIASLKANNAPTLSLPSHILAALPSHETQPWELIPIPRHLTTAETDKVLLLLVGNTSDLEFVEPLTALTIFVCFVWLFRVSWKTAKQLDAKTGGLVKED